MERPTFNSTKEYPVANECNGKKTILQCNPIKSQFLRPMLVINDEKKEIYSYKFDINL